MAVDLVVYFDKNQLEHEAQVAALSPTHKLVTLDLYGRDDAPPEEVRYVAAWVGRAGPVQHFYSGLSRDQLVEKITAEEGAGYRPALLGASGNQYQAVFAAVFEPLDARELTVTFDSSDWFGQEWDARTRQRVPRSVSLYGPVTYYLYAVVWERVRPPLAWASAQTIVPPHGVVDTSAEFQQRFNAWYAHGMRPSVVSVLPREQPDLRQLFSIFRDDFVGWRLTRHGWSQAALATELRDQALLNNMYPICLSGGGAPGNPRFAAVLVQQEQPSPRQWRATGPEHAPLAAIDGYMRTRMQPAAEGDPHIRAGALAVVRQGELVYARGYSWAEAGYETTLPTSLFRLASCTKPLTALAVFRLIEQGRLGLDTRLDFIVGDLICKPDGSPPLDPRWGDITIDHLLTHNSGLWRDALREDFTTQLFGTALPPTHEQVISSLAARMLRYDPGAGSSDYSNVGFILLGMVIQRLTGLRHEEAMDQLVFRPLGLTRPRLARSLVEHRLPGEVRYEGDTPRLSQSVRQQTDRPLVPQPYGGFSIEQFGGAGAYVASVVDYARVLAALDAAGNPLLTAASIDVMLTPPSSGVYAFRGMFPGFTGARSLAWHNGYLPGNAALAWRRDDGISVAMAFNKNTWLYPWDEIANDVNSLLEGMTDWPAQDLFPTFGLPSF